MTLLEFSQIFFDLIASAAIIIITVFISVICYSVIKFFNATKQVAKDIGRGSSELYRKIDGFLESALAVKFISKFFNKKTSKKKQYEED